ncbi:hypothetical protein BDN72DRAFT_962444 [Pluteus cervinus]|uniref:Uncharacterized protein n=1 Tax=Pluteus cervinus TaxID=181527 RepID=A0ACD3AIR4_9AGAR|nr:hypothetical protein BDN72DRAFT_962444 [Pluteus cervinus]
MSSSPSLDDYPMHENGKRKLEVLVPNKPARKRAKLTSTSSFVRHQVWWAEDGSVFLQFGETRMKVHRSRLAAHSMWFRELFERKGAESAEAGYPWAVVNGVDVFQLDGSGVSLTDFEAVLTALENGLNYYYTGPTFSFIASLVRAASFFKFGAILGFATRYLEEMFPEDVGEVTKELIPIAQVTEATLLGRKCGLPQLLKRAFYELARAPGSEEPLTKENRRANILDPNDLLLISNLQKQLTSTWLKILISFPAAECRPPTCASSRSRALALSLSVVQDYHIDPICGFQELMKMDWVKYGCCPRCRTTRIDWVMEQRDELWDKITDWLGLDADLD